MGIGTSLGAYFETPLDHHAGNEYLDNPNSTPDNNELSTNEIMPKTTEPDLSEAIEIGGTSKKKESITFDSNNPDRRLSLDELHKMTVKERTKYYEDQKHYDKINDMLDKFRLPGSPDLGEYREDKPGPREQKSRYEVPKLADDNILNPDKSLPGWVGNDDTSVLNADKLVEWNRFKNKKSMFYLK